MIIKILKGMQTRQHITQSKKVQGDSMSRGTVIKYEDNRGQDVFMVILGDDGEVATGIQLYPSSRRDSVPVYGLFALPSRLRFVYFNNIPDYRIDGYLSDSDLKALLAAVGVYLGFEVVAGEETPPKHRNPLKRLLRLQMPASWNWKPKPAFIRGCTKLCLRR